LDLKDIVLPDEIKSQFIPILSKPIFFIDLDIDTTYLPVGSLLYWLLYGSGLPGTVNIFICKSQFIDVHCAQCNTKLGKITQSPNRRVLPKLPQQPKHFSVLEYYTFMLYSSNLYSSTNWYIVTTNQERFKRITGLTSGTHSLSSLSRVELSPNLIDLNDPEHIDVLPPVMKDFFDERTMYDQIVPPEEMAAVEDTRLEDTTLEAVVDNIIKWIGQIQKGTNQSHLPKTLTKLENAIKKRQCLYRYSIDQDKVLSTLINEGYIEGCLLCGSIFYPKRKTEVYLSKPQKLVFSKDVNELGIDKMKLWIQSQPVLPTTMEALQNHIDTIKIAHGVESTTVIKKLLDMKIVAYKEQEISRTDNPYAFFTSSRTSDEIIYSAIPLANGIPVLS